MSVKNTMTRLAEKITGRKCTRCWHNYAGRCCHPDGRMFMRCWQSITRPGYRPLPTGSKARTVWEFVQTGKQEQSKPELPLDEDMDHESGLLTED